MNLGVICGLMIIALSKFWIEVKTKRHFNAQLFFTRPYLFEKGFEPLRQVYTCPTQYRETIDCQGRKCYCKVLVIRPTVGKRMDYASDEK